jgi:cation-transporting P-type ATPase D
MKSSIATKVIYENCIVYHPSGELMFRCNSKRIKWYLKKGLAEKVSDRPLSIKLLFMPKGMGNAGNENNFGLELIENICVNCGSDHSLTRHHVVPRCYRKHLPENFKCHKFHDIVILCFNCHKEYESKATEFKKALGEFYKAPLDMRPVFSQKVNRAISRYRNIKRNPEMPPSIKEKMIGEIRELVNIDNVSEKELYEIKNSAMTEHDHGKKVVESLKDYKEFIFLWREHFYKNNDCKYLPKNWTIDMK